MLKRYNKQIKRKKGQSTVEYILLVAAIIAALIVFLRPGGEFQVRYNDTLKTGTTGMIEVANRLSASRPAG